MNQTFNTKLIKNYMRENNLSKKSFCKVCNISPLTLDKILNQKTNIRILAIFKIARALQVKVHLLFSA